MTLFVLAYLGGILTIISPCILPVIPFVLARADRPFLRDGLPILIGMALAFAVVASLASVAGGWVVSANQYGRLAALVLLAAFGLTLVFPGLADHAMQPMVGIGARISRSAEQAGEGSVLAPLVLGVATGFLWAPCSFETRHREWRTNKDASFVLHPCCTEPMRPCVTPCNSANWTEHTESARGRGNQSQNGARTLRKCLYLLCFLRRKNWRSREDSNFRPTV